MNRQRKQVHSGLTRKGFRIDKDADHDYYWLYLGETKQSIHTKISRGARYQTIGDDLISFMAKQLKLTRIQFLELVDCPLTADKYLECLRSQQIHLKAAG